MLSSTRPPPRRRHPKALGLSTDDESPLLNFRCFRSRASLSFSTSSPSDSLVSSDTSTMDGARPEKRRRLDRTPAACDLCKSRKVKCDGARPCSYCTRKDQSDSCTFSGPKPRGAKSTTNTPANRDNDTNETLPQARERRYTDPEPTLRSETHGDNSGPSARLR